MNVDIDAVIQLPDTPNLARMRLLLDLYDYLTTEYFDNENSREETDHVFRLAQRVRDELLAMA